jgi:hypothetical protein
MSLEQNSNNRLINMIPATWSLWYMFLVRVIVWSKFAVSSRNFISLSSETVYFLSYSDSWPVKIRPIRCPETSISNYHTTPRNIPEERRSQTVHWFNHRISIKILSNLQHRIFPRFSNVSLLHTFGSVTLRQTWLFKQNKTQRYLLSPYRKTGIMMLLTCLMFGPFFDTQVSQAPKDALDEVRKNKIPYPPLPLNNRATGTKQVMI